MCVFILKLIFEFQFSLDLISNPYFAISAKGRTNVELREQFTLASGVSQSMTAFKAKPKASESSPNSSVSGQGSGQRPSMSGPITKVSKRQHENINESGHLFVRIYLLTLMNF